MLNILPLQWPARTIPMHARSLFLINLVCLVFLPDAVADVRFNRDVRPIFAEFCLSCHGPDDKNREADLRLDVAADARKKSLVPGNPEKSRLYRRITSNDPEQVMPPPESKKSLSAAQVETLKQWISEGARYEDHWAFEPIIDPKVPGESTEGTEIDRFVNQVQKQAGVKLSPSVSREQLIRRATIDLTGLPPTWNEVQEFLHDNSPNAYEKLINRLLDSPRYGERWGRHWLDLARYADTHGGSAIGFQKFPFSYTYRDYVINALNADLPYNRFIMEQLAADQMKLPSNDPALAGLGFLTVGMQFRNKNDVIDDQIDVTTRGLLGLTVACARCHDHKYDPVPTADYYSLYATFGSSIKPELPPIVGKVPESNEYREYARELDRRRVLADDMARDQIHIMQSRMRMQVAIYLDELARGTPEQDLSSAFLSYRTDDIRPLVLNRWRDYLDKMPVDDPVFGPWLALFKLDREDKAKFAEKAPALIAKFKAENGDPAKFAVQQNTASVTAKWNPRVIDALSTSKLNGLRDAAAAYGRLFALVNREWLTALMESTLEAADDGKIVQDEDPKHIVVNSAINQQLRRHLFEPGTPFCMDDVTAATLLNRTVHDSLRGKQGAIEALHLGSPASPPRAMVLEEKPPSQPFRIFRRGNPVDRGEIVEPHFLTILTRVSGGPAHFPAEGRRLALARAMVEPSNPLLRRVFVNWMWQHHFGRGLVRTPDDFGTRSKPPRMPQLLDYLASRVIDDGWSLKKMHRRIMLSKVYQQGAVENAGYRMKDPDNELFWRMPRRKIDMEVMRDSMLAVAGELDTRHIGGRPFDLEAKPIVPRRSVYGFINRDIINPFSSTFDSANPTTCTMIRPETTVPQQTLFALNSDFVQDRAAALIKPLLSVEGVADRIRDLYRRVYSREPSSLEIVAAEKFIGNREGEEPWRELAHVLLASNEFVFVD